MTSSLFNKVSYLKILNFLGTENDGENVTFTPSWDYTIVHMKEGTIIPYQDTNEKRFDTTTNLIKDDGLDLLIFPNSNGFAEGTVYIDNNGDSENDFEANFFEYYKIRFSQKTITIDLIDGEGSSGDITKGNHIIENIYILGQMSVSNLS